METPLVNKQYKLHKFPGKGGWTYAEIPEIPQDKKAPFGWVKVKGSIDDYTFSDYRLMPMGNGHLFLPVNAAVRKKIGKGEGDYVQVVLFKDESDLQIPQIYCNAWQMNQRHRKNSSCCRKIFNGNLFSGYGLLKKRKLLRNE